MKKIVKKFIYTLHKNPLSKYQYHKEIQSRSLLPSTDIEKLSKNIDIFSPHTNELQPLNDWYGHATTLKTFLKLSKNYQFKFILEHGTYLSNQVADLELESDLPTYITYSPYRAKVLRKYRSHTYSIGPFIHYANHFLKEEDLRKEKEKLGKTLLFFPSHSLVGLTNDYNMNWSYKKIMTLGKKFDTIRICIYWKDVLLGRHKFYQAKGFECVTAGHILDPLFLPRLKSIIHNADLTISNDASTPLSYCIYMNKPHIIFYQRPKMTGKKYLKQVMLNYWKSEIYKQIVKEFSKVQFSISPKQRELMNYYCGTNSTKNKLELLRIIKETEEIYKSFQKNK